ncbi:unnamed protein product [Clonostachys rosea f. rosea IK726]|uniref:Uncharacterized protein n=2 Tax=Bionectria ochroleuca TaxID=29856 RepID=A0A0B7JPQ9_BIOOC|nr:unnamed protein product [Clonostachys rosea f. rosea IK726]
MPGPQLVARLLACSALCLNIVLSQSEKQPELAAIPIIKDGEPQFASAVEPPLIQPTEVRKVIVTMEQPRVIPHPDTPRHKDEKARLLERLPKNKGTWNGNHVRHRLLDALYGFVKYQERQNEELVRLRGLYTNTAKHQKALLEKFVQYSDKFTQIEKLLAKNQELCDRIVESALSFYAIDRSELNEHIKNSEKEGRKADKISVSQSLKHIVRDWTAAGGTYERDDCFACLTGVLEKLYPDRDERSKPLKILLPGAGIGRLGHEIAELGGFEVTINEWSMYMNVAYRFLETHGHRTNSETFHPFVDLWSHHASAADMQRPVTFPDAPVNASEVLLVEGDFTTVFNTKPFRHYDVIVTYFFIDTARNLASYFDTIETLLRPGGYWINLGPLLYGTAPFVQLSLEEIIIYAEEGLGFKFLDVAGSECGELTFPDRHVRGMEAAYGFNDRALTKNAYKAQFWVAQRP